MTNTGLTKTGRIRVSIAEILKNFNRQTVYYYLNDHVDLHLFIFRFLQMSLTRSLYQMENQWKINLGCIDSEKYIKSPKNLDTRKICCNHPKILTR